VTWVFIFENRKEKTQEFKTYLIFLKLLFNSNETKNKTTSVFNDTKKRSNNG
jgi:hypothetical protein